MMRKVLLVLGLLFGGFAAAAQPVTIAALGDSLSLGDAWGATNGAMGDLLVLAILAVLGSVLIDLPVLSLMNIMPLAMTWTFVTAWIKTMVGASILTTIYGHYVEGRPLA